MILSDLYECGIWSLTVRENIVLGRLRKIMRTIFSPKKEEVTKLQKDEENYMMRSFIICRPTLFHLR
jgi:hypothetical protein